MKRSDALALLAVAIIGTALPAGCSRKADTYFPGYAEAEYVRLASSIAGTLQKLHVRRGAAEIAGELRPVAAIMIVAGMVALKRYRQTLD
jgi:hypothetical protein